MVGCVKQSTGDTYRMYNLSTNRVTSTRDVKLKNRLLEEMKTEPKQQDDYYTASEDEEESTQTIDSAKQEDDTSAREPRQSQRLKTRSEAEIKVARALRKLDILGNVAITGLIFVDDLAILVRWTDDSYDNPETFKEVWEHPNRTEKEFWREALRREFNDMIKRKVWRETNIDNIPDDRRLIGSK